MASVSASPRGVPQRGFKRPDSIYEKLFPTVGDAQREGRRSVLIKSGFERRQHFSCSVVFAELEQRPPLAQ